jgi:hypothetical protein
MYIKSAGCQIVTNTSETLAKTQEINQPKLLSNVKSILETKIYLLGKCLFFISKLFLLTFFLFFSEHKLNLLSNQRQ